MLKINKFFTLFLLCAISSYASQQSHLELTFGDMARYHAANDATLHPVKKITNAVLMLTSSPDKNCKIPHARIYSGTFPILFSKKTISTSGLPEKIAAFKPPVPQSASESTAPCVYTTSGIFFIKGEAVIEGVATEFFSALYTGEIDPSQNFILVDKSLGPSSLEKVYYGNPKHITPIVELNPVLKNLWENVWKDLGGVQWPEPNRKGP